MDLEELKKQPYEVIADKTLSNQDHLFKLIIIGDTGTHFNSILFYSFSVVDSSTL